MIEHFSPLVILKVSGKRLSGLHVPTSDKLASWCLTQNIKMIGKMTVFLTLYLAILKSSIGSHGIRWRWDVSLKKKNKPATKFEAPEPTPRVEEAGTGMLHACLPCLPGWWPHPGDRPSPGRDLQVQALLVNHWNIEHQRLPWQNHSRELIFQFSLPLFSIILYLPVTCKIKKWSGDAEC